MLCAYKVKILSGLPLLVIRFLRSMRLRGRYGVAFHPKNTHSGCTFHFKFLYDLKYIFEIIKLNLATMPTRYANAISCLDHLQAATAVTECVEFGCNERDKHRERARERASCID